MKREAISSFDLFATFFFFLLLCVCADCVRNISSALPAVGCNDRERKALLTFRQDLEDPYGWLSSWAGQDCCRWKGVGCSRLTGNVLRLDLGSPVSDHTRYLGGKINPSILELKQLTHLDLSINDFSGVAIQTFLGSFDKLVYLNISFTLFTGTVPPHFGNLSNLCYLDLHSLFRSSIPALHWVSRLASLEYLDLSYNDLSLSTAHWFQAFNSLPYLTELHLSSCDLDSLPSSLPHLNFTSLSVIDLSFNEFNSVVPRWLLNITSSLDELNLRYCYLNDLFLQVANGGFCNSRLLDLAGNDIKGEISEFVAGLFLWNNNSLEVLDLSDNQLKGEFRTDSFEPFNDKLRELDLGWNSISGPIPVSIERLSALESINLNHNNMSGSIPENLGNLHELTALSLLNNPWESAPSGNSFAGLIKLKQFHLSSSQSTFLCNMGQEWNPIFSLEVIHIRGCQLGPKFPSWLKTQTQLSKMTLENVGISDTFPSWFWKTIAPQLTLLELSHNQIRGTLPSSIEFGSDPYGTINLSFNRLEGHIPLCPNVSILILRNNSLSGAIPAKIGHVMPLLKHLDLAFNSLNGSIPSSLGKIQSLRSLVLLSNNLSGRIHDQWSELQKFMFLDLSKNNLHGELPASIGSLASLGWLKLNNNNFSGEFNSSSLRNCTQLLVIDLGRNKFSGVIPEWIGHFPSLSELGMRGNLFTGQIPRGICSLSNLHVLDLGVNNLLGTIPPCLGNMSGFSSVPIDEPDSVIDMELLQTGSASSMSYDGDIEMELVQKGRVYSYSSILKFVQLIDLSSNNLKGGIPEEITNLSLLMILNLSHNQLSGEIPKNIQYLQHLETLDISCNYISGPIPPSMSSMTSLNSLNMSHNHLAGPIPSTNQFQTFNNASIYEGNPQLCGPPLLTQCIVACGGNTGCTRKQAKETNDEDEHEKLGLYISITLGFVVGFWAVCGSLAIKESWRSAFFQVLAKVNDWIIVIVPITMARLNRMRGSERN